MHRHALQRLSRFACGLAAVLFLAGSLLAETRVPTFENDVGPILTRFGCNMSGCHGKAEGQNGFKLSVFGFDPDADFRAIAMESRGRRVSLTAPETSLLLQKASGGRPHGGGVRIPVERPEYDTLKTWIAAGLPRSSPDDPRVVKIALDPREQRLTPGGQQALRVIATWSDNREEDVTRLARFQSNNEALAAVDEDGLVSVGQNPGVVAVMASFMGQVDVFQAIVPRVEPLPASAAPPEFNFIDTLVYKRLALLNVAPAELCTDAEFARRVHLDLIGKLPTAAETRQFLADARPDRRAQLVNRLLERPEFADYWALKLADLLRVDRQALGHKAARAQHHWIRQSLAANKPLDQFAREILTAEGPLEEAPQGYLFKTVPEAGKAASTLSQALLGVRMECAQCHHHPYDRWSQTDYAGLSAYFAPLQTKKTAWGEAIVVAGNAASKHPRTGADVPAHPLGEAPPKEVATGDQRAELAKWMTAPSNPFFARNWANRVWAHLLGRGLVEPVDDFRLTNPPSNPALLDALAQSLIESKYDLRALLRTMTASRVYQQSSLPNATNEKDQQNYSRFLLKRLDAEVLLDAVCDATGVPEKFEGVPAGSRAVELWDSQVDHYFLRLFGRPTRQTVCECERVSEPSVAQVLHLLNSERVQEKLARADGRVHRLATQFSDDGALAEEMYVTVFNRLPTAAERQRAIEHLAKATDRVTARDEAAEDLAWSMLNSLEFIFNH
jgi:hypothetical protein